MGILIRLMKQTFSRVVFVAWVVATTAVAVFAGDQKCSGTARECDQQIRQFLSGKRFLGATIDDKNPGLVIKSVAPNGPAENAGLLPGDRLIACNSKSLTHATSRDFKQLLADARATGELRFIVWRRGVYKRIRATLEPYSKEQLDKIIDAHLSQSHPSSAGAH